MPFSRNGPGPAVPPLQPPDRAWRDEVLVLRGDDRTGLTAEVESLLAALGNAQPFKLNELARSLNERCESDGVCLSLVARDYNELTSKLRQALTRLKDRSCSRIQDRSGLYFFEEPLDPQCRVAFLFPGEGSQYGNMLADLALHFAEIRESFDLVAGAFAADPRMGLLGELIFPLEGKRAGGDKLFEMDVAATAMFAANQGLFKLLTSLGLRADAMVGHSTGEYSALCAAGALRFRDEMDLIATIRNCNGLYRRQADDVLEGVLIGVGGMAADTVRAAVELIGGILHIAIHNCPNQLVIFGSRVDVDRLERVLRADGGVVLPLPFGRAYHTPLFAGFAEHLRPFLDSLDFGPPEVELWSCATAAPFPSNGNRVRQLALAQWTRPVRFHETINAMYDAGIRIFIEVGPRGNLAAFVQDILRGKPFLAVPVDVPHRSGIRQLCQVLALLSAQRRAIAFDRLYAEREVRQVPLAALLGQSARQIQVQLALGLPTLSLSLTPVATVRPPARATGRAPVSSPAIAKSAVSVPRFRAAALVEYQRTMNCFLCVQEDVVLNAIIRRRPAEEGAYSRTGTPERPAPRPTAEPESHFPLIGEILTLRPGREIVAERRLCLDEDPFLRDHVLGGQISVTDDDLLPLPIMPMTVSMEMMAEAASILLPGLRMIGFRSVRAHRWIPFEQHELRLRVAAIRENDGHNVQVRLYIVDSAGEQAGEAAVEGVVQFDIDYPAIGKMETEPQAGGVSVAANLDKLYTRAMFSGPRFRSVRSLERVGAEGAEAILEALPTDGFFRDGRRTEFLAEPVLLDGAGQVVGFWTAERLPERFVVFPVGVDELSLYGPPLPPATRVRCRARIAQRGKDEIVSTIDIMAPDERLHARLWGWTDRRFDLTASASAFVLSPLAGCLTAEADTLRRTPVARSGVSCRIADSLNQTLAPFSKPIWQEALARLILSRSEREEWRAFADMLPAVRPKRSWEWLLARLAAKDAVRCLVNQSGGPDLLPADIEIATEKSGRPIVSSSIPGMSTSPIISLSHCGAPAAGAAMAADSAMTNSVGLDVERVRPMEPIFVEAAFDSGERALLAEPPQHDEWLLRGWTAKEAAAKAAGLGDLNWPLAWRICDLDRETGTMNLKHRRGGAALRAQTSCSNGLVLAAVVLPREVTEQPLPHTVLEEAGGSQVNYRYDSL